MATLQAGKLLILCAGCILVIARPLAAREVQVGGGIGSGYEYYSRKDKKDNQETAATADSITAEGENTSSNDQRYHRLRVSPLLTVKSESARDVLSLRYSPSVRYDIDDKECDVDQDFDANVTYSLTRNWQVKINERYLLADQNIQDKTGANTVKSSSATELSDNDGVRRYWKNDLSLSSAYTYWEDSSLTLGYSLGHLTHTEVGTGSSYEDYVRHNASAGLTHRFDSVWKLSVDGNYSRGLFEAAEKSSSETAAATAAKPLDDNDLHEFRAATQLEARHFEHHLLSLKYGFVGVDYDDPERNTTTLNGLTAGWQWQLAKDTSLFLGAGPSYNKIEDQEGNWGYNANAKLRYGFNHSAFELSLAHGYDVQNFTGTNESGLRDYWQSRLDFSRLLVQDLSMKLFTTYRYEDQEEITKQLAATNDDGTATTGAGQEPLYQTDIFNRQRLGAGTSLAYTFARWYAMNLSYNYLIQDSEKVEDSYDEHRLILSLSIERELFQW